MAVESRPPPLPSERWDTRMRAAVHGLETEPPYPSNADPPRA